VPEDVAGQESDDGLPPGEPRRDRRHLHLDVGSEQVDQRAGVGAGERVDVALEEGLPGLLVGLGEVVLHRSDLVQVGSRATQRAVDGRRRGVEHLGDLGRPERQHVAQRQHGALTCRQHLESGHEGEPDGAAAHHDRRRVIGVEQRVGHRLEPCDRALERGHGRPGVVRRRSQTGRERTSGAGLQRGQARHGGDLVQPPPQ
jgi:hypothetical protein